MSKPRWHVLAIALLYFSSIYADQTIGNNIVLTKSNVADFGITLDIGKEFKHKDDYLVALRYPLTYNKANFVRIYLEGKEIMFPELFGKQTDSSRILSFNMSLKLLKTVKLYIVYEKYIFTVSLAEFCCELTPPY